MPCEKINTKTVNDRAKLLMHRLVARHISQHPDLIEAVKNTLSTGPKALSSNKEWLDILNHNPEEVRKILTVRTPKMTRLRASSPFSFVIDLKDPTIRRKIWKLAKKGNLEHKNTNLQ